MLDTTAAILVFLGGVFIAIIGAIANYATRDQGNKVNAKTLVRDFLIGLFLSGSAYFIIPDSFETLGKTIQEVKLPELSGGAASLLDGGIDANPARF